MKNKLILSLTIFILLVQISHAQKFTFGIENGINYSNVHKKYDSDRYAALQGPINGIFAKYQFANFFLLESGINHSTFHFNKTQYLYYDYYVSSSSYYDQAISSIYSPDYYCSTTSTHYSFLRVPLLVKFRTPGRINVELGGGSYYAVLTNDEYRGKDHDMYTKEYRDENFPKMHDWGWILESSINYNINPKWSVFVSGRITYGKEKYFENVEGKIGSSELTFGVGYSPFAKSNHHFSTDSLGQNISILPHSGILISNTKSNKNKSKYKSSLGFSSGVSIQFGLNKNLALLTGAWYERKGYGLDYQGSYKAIYHNPTETERENAPHIESEVQLDYVTLPLLLNIHFGDKIQSNINLGSYFSLLQNAFAEGEKLNTYVYDQGYRMSKNYFNDSLDKWFKNTDAGFMFSYKIDFPVFQWANVFIWLNQSFGEKNILINEGEEINGHNFVEYEKIHNSATSILFGLTIPVNKN